MLVQRTEFGHPGSDPRSAISVSPRNVISLSPTGWQNALSRWPGRESTRARPAFLRGCEGCEGRGGLGDLGQVNLPLIGAVGLPVLIGGGLLAWFLLRGGKKGRAARQRKKSRLIQTRAAYELAKAAA